MFCRACGRQNSPTARFCGQCGAPLAAPAPVPPPVPQWPASPAPPLASLGRRTLAAILDGILMMAAFAIVGTLVARRYGGLTGNGFSMEVAPALLTIALTLLLGILYYWLSEGLFGASFGKAILGVEVRGVDGGRCGLGRSLVRNMLRIIDAFAVYLVGFLAAMLSKSRQRIGDHAAGTIVVRRPAGGAACVLAVLAWLALLGGGIAAAWRLHPGAQPEGFAVVDFAFLESKGGAERSGKPYKPGDTVYVKFTLAGYRNDAASRADFTVRTTPLDPAGSPLCNPWEDRTSQTLARRTTNYTLHFELPPFAPPGRYRFDIRGRDAVAGADTALAPEFAVDAPAPVSAAQLEVRNFRFSSTKGGPGEDPFIARAGGTLHMAAEIAGIRFRQDQPNARVALQISDPDGRTLFSKPDFLKITEAQAYHPPSFFAPMSGLVNLPSGMRAGAYAVRIAVADYVAGDSLTFERTFRVE